MMNTLQARLAAILNTIKHETRLGFQAPGQSGKGQEVLTWYEPKV